MNKENGKLAVIILPVKQAHTRFQLYVFLTFRMPRPAYHGRP